MHIYDFYAEFLYNSPWWLWVLLPYHPNHNRYRYRWTHFHVVYSLHHILHLTRLFDSVEFSYISPSIVGPRRPHHSLGHSPHHLTAKNAEEIYRIISEYTPKSHFLHLKWKKKLNTAISIRMDSYMQDCSHFRPFFNCDLVDAIVNASYPKQVPTNDSAIWA